MSKIMIIDDDKDLLEAVSKKLTAVGHEVIVLDTPLGSSQIIKNHAPDLVLVDQKMPILSGGSLIRTVRWLKLDTVVVLFSNLDKDSLQEIARECGADGYICKVDGIENMLGEVEKFLNEDKGEA